MKAFLRLVREVCAVGKLSVQALSRTYKIVGTARKRSLMMPACRRQECERLVMSALVSFGRRFLRSALSTSLPSVEMTRGKVGLGSLDRFEVTFGKPAVPHSAKARRALKPYSLHLIPLNYLKPYTIYLTALNVLFCVCLAHARQSSSLEAAHGVALSTDTIKPLQIGDTIPEALWHMPLQTVKAGRAGSTTITLNDYRGKLIILDFWATWCVPCVKSLKKLDSLKTMLGQDVIVIPTGYESEAKVSNLLQRQHIELPSVYGDTVLKRYFPHQIVPHQVWIKDNKLRVISDADFTNLANIKKVLMGDSIEGDVKNDFLYQQAFLQLNNAYGKRLGNAVYYTALTGYVPQMNAVSNIVTNTINKTRRITFINHSLYTLCKNALSLDWLLPNRMLFIGVDKKSAFYDESCGLTIDEWRKQYAVSYEGALIQGMGANELKERLFQDLHTFKGIVVRIEERKENCYLLQKSKPFNKTNIGKVAFMTQKRLLNLLNRQSTVPILDATELEDDAPFPKISVSDVKSLEDFNKVLAPIGLRLKPAKRKLSFLIVEKI
ncbi:MULTISPECIES: TlpA family protein disulfide reductase [Olivibacter]|uniref:TlpA family protein disulfide reductase n=1 Tax=Olivibacter oleidegradans TaxID=760123 RepID=A0ABV6HGD8_9SPHI|nr:TlpA disulfide reductase family protein [Olivibacter jilunii]